MRLRARSVDRAWFHRNGFWCGGDFEGAVRESVSWGAFGLLLTLLANVAADHSSGKYLTMAALEGLGPSLWNVAGSVGLVFFGAFLIRPGLAGTAYLANLLLSGTHSLGACMAGVILGGLLVQIPAMVVDHGWGMVVDLDRHPVCWPVYVCTNEPLCLVHRMVSKAAGAF